MSYIVRYTTLSGKQITMPHRIFESVESAKAHGEQRVSEGNYRSYTVMEAKEGDKIKYRNIKSKRTKTGTVKKVDTKNGQKRYEIEGGKYVYDSDLEEGYKILPPMDREKYQERPGLEGPFRTLSGKVIYYDPREGSYYDPDTDMYLSYDEFQQLDNDYSNMKDERDIPVREGKNAADHRQGLVDKIKKSGVVKSGSMSKEQKKPKKSRVNEAYVKTSKDAINALGALRKIGKHIETGRNTYDGNLANQFANDVYDVIRWVENNLDTNDAKYKQVLAPVIELRKKAKSMEREPGSGKNARFGNEIVNTLYPLMSWIQNNAVGMNEGISDDAHHMERDHEVQMARSELYKTANYAIKLHSILKGISEEQGLEGWMQSKITKAADYLSSVFHALEYDEMERRQGNLTMPMGESRDPADAFAREQGGRGAAAASGTVKKIKTKDGKHEAWWAKNNSGTMKTFQSEKAARKFARSSDVGETTSAGAVASAPMPMKSVTESREMTKAAVMKKIKAGEWEATQDLKPGKRCEVRNTATGKRMQIMIKEADMGQAASVQDRKDAAGRKSYKYKVVDSKGKTISTHNNQGDAIRAANRQDDYSVKKINETTTAGAVASAPMPMGKTIKRRKK